MMRLTASPSLLALGLARISAQTATRVPVQTAVIAIAPEGWCERQQEVRAKGVSGRSPVGQVLPQQLLAPPAVPCWRGRRQDVQTKQEHGRQLAGRGAPPPRSLIVAFPTSESCGHVAEAGCREMGFLSSWSCGCLSAAAAHLSRAVCQESDLSTASPRQGGKLYVLIVLGAVTGENVCFYTLKSPKRPSI